MSHFESFGAWISDYASKVLVPAVKTRVSPPKSLGMKVFQAYMEIHTSCERLRQITRCASQRLPASLNVSKSDYLRFQIESYFRRSTF